MEKIKIEKGDVILMRSKDETVECMLVLDRMQEGIKVLIVKLVNQ